MVRKIKIPHDQIEGIVGLAKLSSDNFKKLSEILRTLPKGASHAKFIQTVAPQIEDEDESISEAVFSFGGLLTKIDLSQTDEVANDIVEHINYVSGDNNDDESLLTEEESSILLDRISYILLNLSSISPTFEAYEIIRNTNNVIIESKVKSDFRMIVDRGDNSRDRNAVLFYNISIVSKKQKELTTETFVLDLDDLKELQKQIEVAILDYNNITAKYADINFIDIS